MSRGLLALRAAGWTIAIALGGLQAASHPYRLSSDDAVSYLDLADAYLGRDWKAVLNAYWSPLYPWLLALAKWVTNPTPVEELRMFRFVNFGIYLAAIASFDFFLRRVIADHEAAVAREAVPSSLPVPRWFWVTGGYLLFIWSTLAWINLRSDTPDLCTAVLVYLAAALMLGSQGQPLTVRRGLAFGAIVGLACLSKTAVFIVAPILLLAGGLTGGARGAPVRLGVVVLGWVLVAGPFVAGLSLSKGRATVGDTGSLNYSWIVNPGGYLIPDQHWQGGPPAFGQPRHPSRLIWSRPETFEFGRPVRGTYPPWSDPSYWYEGLAPRFDASKQWRTVQVNARFYRAMFVELLVLLYAVLAVGGVGWSSTKATVMKNWRLVLPALAGLSVYLIGTNLAVSNIPTQPSTRYVASFIVLLFAAAVSGIRLKDSRRSRVALAALTAAALSVGVVKLGAMSFRELQVRHGPSDDLPWRPAADMVWNMGVGAGERVGIVGDKREHEVWARVTRVRIVAQVPDSRVFLRSDPEVQEAVRRSISLTGAKVLVLKPRVGSRAPGPEWASVGNEYYVMQLRANDTDENKP